MSTTPLNLPSVDTPHSTTYQARPPRRRTCLSGKLVFGDGMLAPDGGFTVDCAIRDISEGGAKVVIDKLQALPRDLYLIVAKYRVAYQARVMWMNFPARGLKFSRSYSLNGSLLEELAFLRRLCSDLYVRCGSDDA